MLLEFLALAQLALMDVGAARERAATSADIATCASGSRSKRRSASARCRTRSSLKAFNRSGRFNVKVATWLLQAYSTRLGAVVSVMVSPSVYWSSQTSSNRHPLYWLFVIIVSPFN